VSTIKTNTKKTEVWTLPMGHFTYWTVCLLLGHFAYWTLHSLAILPKRHYAYGTFHLLDSSPTICTYLFVISTSVINCLGRFVPEMTYYVLSGTSNLTKLKPFAHFYQYAWRLITVPSAWNVYWYFTLLFNMSNPGWNLMFYCKLYILACRTMLECAITAICPSVHLSIPLISHA